MNLMPIWSASELSIPRITCRCVRSIFIPICSASEPGIPRIKCVRSIFIHLFIHSFISLEMKWNESGFRPPLCTYRLNWARRTSWGWWDDTVLQTQDSKFEPWRSEAEHATSRLPTILTFTRGWGRNIFVSLKPPRPGTEPRTLAWKATVLTTTLGPPPSPPSSLWNNASIWELIPRGYLTWIASCQLYS